MVETARPRRLPIRLRDAEIVDPVPVRAGMINNNSMPGFDAKGRATITFHKFDAAGNTQIYVSRREAAGWRSYQASDWRGFRWDFGGNGSLVSRLTLSPTEADGANLRIRVVRDGKPIDLLLDPETLARTGERSGTTLADRLAPRIATPAGMQLNTAEDPSGIAIAWATLPPNRDLPRDDVPEATVLRLVLPSNSPP